jgi:uncharacterized membrane protein YbaN (DUF454 family)
MIKITFIIFGTLFLGLGFIGIVVPGLPATPFFLLSAGCYSRSSKKLYNWLINHKIIGNYIRIFRDHRAMTKKSKIISLVVMWVMIVTSIMLTINNKTLMFVVISAGLVGTIVILNVKTYNEKERLD